jgi:hypothetical protein
MLMLQNVSSSETRNARNTKLIPQNVEYQDKDSQEYNTDATECRSIKTKIFRNRMLMLQNVSSSETRYARNTKLIPQNVEYQDKDSQE